VFTLAVLAAAGLVVVVALLSRAETRRARQSADSRQADQAGDSGVLLMTPLIVPAPEDGSHHGPADGGGDGGGGGD